MAKFTHRRRASAVTDNTLEFSMGHKFAEIAFTPIIREMQTKHGSRASYERMDRGDDYNHRIGEREAAFISARDSFYMATTSETGWPYVQHRGGRTGFMKVLNQHTIGFADFSGNRQYISTGNLMHDSRVALFFMDYPNRTRLKLLGRIRIVDHDEPQILAQLEDSSYSAQIERGFLIEVAGLDWNCPQHITPRFTNRELDDQILSLREENDTLKSLLVQSNKKSLTASKQQHPAAEDILGEGPLELIVSGVRQLTARIRAYELRDPAGGKLPVVDPGSHLKIPVRLPTDEIGVRHYSIASNPLRRDKYEIAVQREDGGNGGSQAVHDSYQIGTRVRMDFPGNHFGLHDDERPAILIAGGIGITAIKSMAQALHGRGGRFSLHYAGRSQADMAFSEHLQRQFKDQIYLYGAAEGNRLNIPGILSKAPKDALVYVCGPDRLNRAVRDHAIKLGIPRKNVRLELFE
jgi:ferredoxin-NADP reductase/predicted pyridoxine 5'-phosphate oxidase superfamily flavin-nucleotide-binding protein